MRVIKSFVREDYESARFEKSNAELKESSLNAFKIAIAQMPLMMLFMNLTTLVVVWLGGNQILGKDAGRRSDGIYNLYCAGADVPDDAGNGIFAELPGIRERTQD